MARHVCGRGDRPRARVVGLAVVFRGYDQQGCPHRDLVSAQTGRRVLCMDGGCMGGGLYAGESAAVMCWPLPAALVSPCEDGLVAVAAEKECMHRGVVDEMVTVMRFIFDKVHT